MTDNLVVRSAGTKFRAAFEQRCKNDVRAGGFPEQGEVPAVPVVWNTFEPGSKRMCRVWILAEDGGGFSALAPHLPGVASQGDTLDETIDHVREALVGALESYREHGEAVPWRAEEAQLDPGLELELDLWIELDG